jgi:hypothetical protein
VEVSHSWSSAQSWKDCLLARVTWVRIPQPPNFKFFLNRMSRFSQRVGIISPKNIIQTNGMDDDLRTGLWNMLSIFLWETFAYSFLYEDENFHLYFKRLWISFFKRPLDSLETYWKDTYSELRTIFFKIEWWEVYDFIEFTVENYPRDNVEDFINGCNKMLERELSAYRFVSNVITEITSKEEINEIEKSLDSAPILIRRHLSNALEKLSDRKNPDFRNSIKESISAVEAVSIKISGDDSATLGKALTQIERNGNVKLHKALKEAFSKLYGYTNDAEGIRHALLDESTLDFEDAKFMLVTASAFVNYLIVKANKAEINL